MVEKGTPFCDFHERGNILIVDDLPENLRLLSKILTTQGHEVWPASNGTMALDTMKRRQPDLVLLDIRMPKIDGFEVCKKMKADKLLCNIPVIFISSLADTEDKIKAFQVGGIDYITKPFHEAEVLVRVNTHLALRRLQQHIEKDLHHAENKYQEIYNAANEAIVIYDVRSSRIIDVNQAAVSITGYSREEMLKLQAGDLSQGSTPYSRKELMNIFRQTNKGGPQVFEWQLRKKNGNIFFVEITLKKSLIAGKEVFIFVARDISDRKAAGEAILKSEALHKEAQKIAQIGHWKLNLINNELIWSDEAYNIFGISQEAFGASYEAFLEIIHPDDRAFVNQSYSDSVKNNKPYDLIHRIITQTGQLKYLHERCRTEYDEAGNPIRSIGTTQDITQLKEAELEKERLESQLRQAQKIEAIGTLAGGIAHDFNNILSPIFGYTEFALGHIAQPLKLKEDLNEILMAAERARNLVRQILTFSRKTDTEKKPLTISLVVKEAVKLLRATIPSTIEIKQEIITDKKVLADPTQMHQIVMNLCTNAYHAIRMNGGILNVSLQDVELAEVDLNPELQITPGNYLQLKIADTGHGIEKQNLESIFEPYFTTKEVGGGTGLGLSVVHGIVKKHNGFIQVYSESGIGTTFDVYLPVADTKVDALPLEEENEPLVGGNERIMVVEDEERILNMIREILSDYGYVVTVFGKATEALQAFEEQPKQCDLIITDMTMPDMTGIRLAREIMEIRPDIPIILTTGYSELVDREQALSMGIKSYVEKPLKMRELIKTVRGVLNHGQSNTI